MNKAFWLPYRAALLTAVLTILSVPWAEADSLWRDDAARPMFSDKRAAAVGDIVTIVVQENNSASKDSTTKTAKNSGNDVGISSFLYGPAASGLMTQGGQYPALKYSSKSSFDGSGSVGSTEKIIARIAVRVVDVLPNRNLLIEGSRKTTFSGETQDVVLRGTVRPEDIAANNTVYSYNVADVTIQFIAKGIASDTKNKGWFSKIFDKINPF
jgi:flagellar L-ring protein FlgH